MSQQNAGLVEHLFRTEYGRIVAILTRLFGTTGIQLAEDVAQEALIAALNTWGTEGVPTNPSGWLIQVAKRKALNVLKRDQMIRDHHTRPELSRITSAESSDIYLDSEIEDNQLRMIFTCCHPSLSTESQIALTLKTLGGFGVSQVANALVVSTSTINKRLYRAKQTIRDSDLPFLIPSGSELQSRLEVVVRTLYLIFNEGYLATTGDSLVQKDLCLEAIRLCSLLTDKFPDQRQLHALLALMCLHSSRLDARIDDGGGIVLFAEQDRSMWDRDLINTGMVALQTAMGGQTLTPYHLEAAIAAQHAMAPNFDSTDWLAIQKNYHLLIALNPSPIIELNLAIIESRINGIEASLQKLIALEESGKLADYHLLPATQGMLCFELNDYPMAMHYFEKSLRINPSSRESDFLKAKIAGCVSNGAGHI